MPEDLDARFGTDPDALAWARGKVVKLRAKYRLFEASSRDEGKPELATQWRKFANLLTMELIGGNGCVITPFDERRPSLPCPTGSGSAGDGDQITMALDVISMYAERAADGERPSGDVVAESARDVPRLVGTVHLMLRLYGRYVTTQDHAAILAAITGRGNDA